MRSLFWAEKRKTEVLSHVRFLSLSSEAVTRPDRATEKSKRCCYFETYFGGAGNQAAQSHFEHELSSDAVHCQAVFVLLQSLQRSRLSGCRHSWHWIHQFSLHWRTVVAGRCRASQGSSWFQLMFQLMFCRFFCGIVMHSGCRSFLTNSHSHVLQLFCRLMFSSCFINVSF